MFVPSSTSFRPDPQHRGGEDHSSEEEHPFQDTPAPFYGETVQARWRAQCEAAGRLNELGTLTHPTLMSPAPSEAIQKLMEETLSFFFNQREIKVTYREILDSFQRSYEFISKKKTLPSIRIEGEELLAVLGDSWAQSALQELGGGSFLKIERRRIETFIDFAETSSDRRIKFGFFQLLGKRYLIDQVPFLVKFKDGQSLYYLGLKTLVSIPFENISAISVRQKGLPQESLTSEQIVLLKNMGQNMEVACDVFSRGLFPDLDYRVLGEAIEKEIPWNNIVGVDTNQNPFAFRFTNSPRKVFVFQDISLNLAPWLSDDRLLHVTGALQAIVDRQCLIVRFIGDPQPSDFEPYWRLITLGYLGVDEKCEKRLLNPLTAAELSKMTPAFVYNIKRNFEPMLELKAFGLLASPLDESRCAFLVTHNGQRAIQLRVGEETYLLPFQPEKALKSILEAKNVRVPSVALPPLPQTTSKTLPINSSEWTKLLLQGIVHPNQEVRSLCLDLLLQFLQTKDAWRECLHAYVTIGSIDKKIFERLGAQYDSSQDFKEQLVSAVARADAEFMPSIAFEIWQNLEDPKKKAVAPLLFSIFKERSPLLAIKLVRQGASLCWTKAQVEQIIRELRPLAKNGERFQIVYGLADLVPHTATPRRLVFELMNGFFVEQDSENLNGFAAACEQKQLLPDDSISTTLALPEQPSEEQVLQQLQKLYKGWQGDDLDLYETLFHSLVEKLSQEKREAAYKESLEWALKAKRIQSLFDHFMEKGLLTSQNALEYALKLEADEAFDFCRHAREKLWTDEDYLRDLETFLKLYRHLNGDDELRKKLSAVCTTPEHWKIWLLALPEIFETVKKQFAKFSYQIRKHFSIDLSHPELPVEEFQIEVVRCLINAQNDFAYELWKRLPGDAKNEFAVPLLEVLKSCTPRSAVALLLQGATENYWKKELLSSSIRAFSKENSLWPLIDSQDLALEILNDFFVQGDKENALAFGRDWKWDRPAFVEAFQPGSVADSSQLLEGWMKEAHATASAVYLHLLEREHPSESVCREWINQTLETHFEKGRLLLKELIQRKMITPSPEYLAESCLNCGQNALYLMNDVRSFWKQEDYKTHYDLFLRFYQKTKDKELRATLLGISPHDTLLSDAREDEFRGLVANISAAGLRQLVAFVKEEDERASVCKNAEQVLPTLWQSPSRSYSDQFDLLETLQRNYRQVGLVSCLQNFPVTNCTFEDLTRYSKLLIACHHADLDAIATAAVRRLVKKELQAALELLAVFPIEESLRAECVQKATGSQNPEYHRHALKSAKTYKEKLLLLRKLALTDPKWVPELKAHLQTIQNEEERLATLETILADPEKGIQLFDEIETLRETHKLLPISLEVKFIKCAFATQTKRSIKKGIDILQKRVNELSPEMRQNLVFIAVTQGHGDVECHPQLSELCVHYQQPRGQPGLEFIELLKNSSSVSLQDRALEIALKLTFEGIKEKKRVSDLYEKLVERAFERNRLLVPKLILNGCEYLPQELLAAMTSTYLDRLKAERKGFDPSGLLLVNQILPCLPDNLKLLCLDKALDHFFLFLSDSTVFTDPAKEFVQKLSKLDGSHFVYQEKPKHKMGIVVPAFLTELAGEMVAELSPALLVSRFMYHVLNTVTAATHLIGIKKQKEGKKIPMTEFASDLQTHVQTVKDKYPDLYINLGKNPNSKILLEGSSVLFNLLRTDNEEDPTRFRAEVRLGNRDTINASLHFSQNQKRSQPPTNFQFLVGCVVVDKCLKLCPTEVWAQNMVMSLLSQTLKVLIVQFPTKSKEWMPRFTEFALCQNGFNPDYFSLHLLDFQVILKMIEESVPTIERTYPQEFFQLRLFFDNHLELSTDPKMRQKQFETAEQLLMKVWKTDALRTCLRTSSLIYTVCRELRHERPESFRVWYNRLIDLLKEKPFGRLEKEIILITLKRDLTEILFSRDNKSLEVSREVCREVHQKRWKEIAELFADVMNLATIDEKQLDNHFELFFDHLMLVDLIFEIDRKELGKSQRELLVGAQKWHRHALQTFSANRSEQLRLYLSHANALHNLKKHLTEDVEREFRPQLHQFWTETLDCLIAEIRTAPIDQVDGTNTFDNVHSDPYSQGFLPSHPDLHDCLVQFLENGRPLFIAQNDFKGYFHLVSTLAVRIFARVPKHYDKGSPYFKSLFKMLLTKFPNEEQLEACKENRVNSLIAIIVFFKNPENQWEAILDLISDFEERMEFMNFVFTHLRIDSIDQLDSKI